MVRIFCGVFGLVLLVASAAVSGEGAAITTASGSYLTISPTSEIIATWPVGGSRISLFGIEKGKPVGHFDAKFAFSTLVFSQSGRFICVGAYTPVYHVAVYDTERSFRRVIDSVGAPGYFPMCEGEGNVRYLDASVLGTRIGHTVVIQRQHFYGGPCPGTPAFMDTAFEYWDAGLKHPKIYKQYNSTEQTC